MTISLADQIAEVRREIKMRERVYADWKIKDPSRVRVLDRQMDRMRAELA